MHGKKILIGISGGIAAYKIPLLVRLLVKAGAEVKVILSPAAEQFVSKVVLAALSKKAVHSSMYNKKDGTWNNHVELGLWADAMLIAPLRPIPLQKCVQVFVITCYWPPIYLLAVLW